jgi:predicted nuclease of predicted toxin-antitoxin system
MRLLLDQNLSHMLIPVLDAAFPGSRHVKDFGLDREDDERIWLFASENGFAIASKDSDFMHRALLRGHPPKVIHVRLGSCSTESIRQLLLDQERVIKQFLSDPVESLLTLG